MRKLSFDLSTLALAALMAVLIPSSVALGNSCAAVTDSGLVSTAISADMISAVSGTELPLRISLTNTGSDSLRNGSIVIVISREPKAGDFSQDKQFILTRAVVKTGVDLGPRSAIKSSFAWKIPAGLPSGLYRADAIFLVGGRVLENTQVLTNSPFGNSAKVFISGEAKGALFFAASLAGEEKSSIVLVNGLGKDVTVPVTLKSYSGGLGGNPIQSESRVVSVKKGSSSAIAYSAPAGVEPFAITAETSYQNVPAFYMYSSGGSAPANCADNTILYSWAMLIGGLGFLMLIAVHARERRGLR